MADTLQECGNNVATSAGQATDLIRESIAAMRHMCLEGPEILQEVGCSLNWIGKVLNYIGGIKRIVRAQGIQRIFRAQRIKGTLSVERIQRIVVAQWIKGTLRVERIQRIFRT